MDFQIALWVSSVSLTWFCKTWQAKYPGYLLSYHFFENSRRICAATFKFIAMVRKGKLPVAVRKKFSRNLTFNTWVTKFLTKAFTSRRRTYRKLRIMQSLSVSLEWLSFQKVSPKICGNSKTTEWSFVKIWEIWMQCSTRVCIRYTKEEIMYDQISIVTELPVNIHSTNHI